MKIAEEGEEFKRQNSKFKTWVEVPVSRRTIAWQRNPDPRFAFRILPFALSDNEYPHIIRCITGADAEEIESGRTLLRDRDW